MAVAGSRYVLEQAMENHPNVLAFANTALKRMPRGVMAKELFSKLCTNFKDK